MENLLLLSGGSAIELARFIAELADELGMKKWASHAGAVRSITQCLNGHPMLEWGYDLIDATIDFLEGKL